MDRKLYLTLLGLRRIIAIVVLITIDCAYLYAQTRVVTGKVISSEDSQGLPGTNILIKGSATGTVTDAQGNYSVEVMDDGNILVFSSIGYATQEVAVSGRSVINVTMTLDIRQLGERSEERRVGKEGRSGGGRNWSSNRSRRPG